MSNDVAGPMLGWSLGALARESRIHDLVSFPCEFCFKVVGRATNATNANRDDDDDERGFVATLLDRVAQVIGRDIGASEHTVRKSARGTYESVTLNLWVTSGDEVYSIYAALSDDERVKYLL